MRRDGDTAIAVGTQNQSGSMQGYPLPFGSVRSTLVLRTSPFAPTLVAMPTAPEPLRSES